MEALWLDGGPDMSNDLSLQGVDLLEEPDTPLPRPLEDEEPLELAVAPRAPRLELLLPRSIASFAVHMEVSSYFIVIRTG